MTFTKMTGDPIAQMQWLKAAINTLRDNINGEYNVPPKYIENLKNIENSLTNIIAKEYGSAKTQEITPVDKSQEQETKTQE
jgi:hypothetical protein